MSTPGSNRNKKYEDGGRKQNGDTVSFTFDSASYSPQSHARAQEYQQNFNRPFDPRDYNHAAPTGALDVRMGTPIPDPPRTAGRHHDKFGSRSATPGPYNGPSAVGRTPAYTTSQRINEFPQDLGGRHRGFSEDPQPSSQRPKDYPKPSYQTVPYASSTPGAPRSPDGPTGHQISMAMAQRPPQSGMYADSRILLSHHKFLVVGGLQQPPRPGYVDPRYSSNGRGCGPFPFLPAVSRL
ncbi:hypothetical protein C8R43DRAFT_979418 [Mycena crocata]|nr:hypothetical protein C8R43DRAFT_979418 [Mycena crocata]